MRNISLIAFTGKGCELAVKVAAGLRAEGQAGGQAEGQGSAQVDVRVFGPRRFAGKLGIDAYESLEAWTAARFGESDALVFVGACGIAVRAIAPHVRDKLADPAVVSVDELGRVVVPLLSGHVGGANDLAVRIARITGGLPAISTATDLNGAFAIDEFARDNGLAIVERAFAKEISAALLEGKPVAFGEGLGAVVSRDTRESPFEKTLHLVPRDVVVGIGCRRGTDFAALEAAVDAALSQAGIAPEAVCGLATIDVKADEPAVIALAQKRAWPLRTYSACELSAVEGEFASSDFVLKTVGVDNVCERAACAQGARLVQGKRSYDGITVALAIAPKAQQAQ